MKVISVVNQKGGVGKTTTALHLSWGLADKGKKVLLVDLDPQGNATLGLGYDKDTLSPTLYEYLLDMVDVQSVILFTKNVRLDLIPSNIHLSAFNEENKEISTEILKEKLGGLEATYEYIVIDCPPNLSQLTVAAMNCSHLIMVPSLAEYFSIEALSQVGKTFFLLKQKNAEIGEPYILFTMVEEDDEYHIKTVEEIKNEVGKASFKTMIPRDRNFSRSAKYGYTIFEFAPESPGAKAYQKLVQEVLEND